MQEAGCALSYHDARAKVGEQEALGGQILQILATTLKTKYVVKQWEVIVLELSRVYK